MDFAFGQIFLYLALIFIINGLLINVFRRFKLADFIAHILTGMLFALILLGWGKVLGPASVKSFQNNFRITGEALESLKTAELPDSLLGQLASMQDKVFAGEDFFVDSLSAKIGEVQTNLYKTNILKFTASSEGLFKDLLRLLTQIGLLLLFMQLGFNFDRKLFSVSGSREVSLAFIIFILNVVVLGGASYLFFLKPNILFSFYLIIAFLSISIGAVLAAKFPASLSAKKQLRNLVQAAVILDLVAIALFTVVGLSLHYSEYGLLRLIKKDLLYWIILSIFAVIVILPLKTEQLFQFLQKFAGMSAVIFKTGLFFLFIYAGFRVGISELLLGFWAGVLLKTFSAAQHIEINQKLFPIASFLYIIPFAEVGRDLALTHWYSSDFGYYFLVLFSALSVISLIAGLTVIRKKEFPLILSLGTFPRGEITVLILWLFRNMLLISPPVFVVAVVVVIVSNLLGSLLARLFFVHSVELQKRMRQR
jgi:Kef-type K+ transport system membrane component KefB